MQRDYWITMEKSFFCSTALFFSFALLFLVIAAKRLFRPKKHRLPPSGPLALPLIGHLHLLNQPRDGRALPRDGGGSEEAGWWPEEGGGGEEDHHRCSAGAAALGAGLLYGPDHQGNDTVFHCAAARPLQCSLFPPVARPQATAARRSLARRPPLPISLSLDLARAAACSLRRSPGAATAGHRSPPSSPTTLPVACEATATSDDAPLVGRLPAPPASLQSCLSVCELVASTSSTTSSTLFAPTPIASPSHRPHRLPSRPTLGGATSSSPAVSPTPVSYSTECPTAILCAD